MSETFLDSSVFIGAYDGNRLIGFIKLTIDDSATQAGMMHIVSLLECREKAPTNALVVQAVRSCADRGISHLVYAKFAYGKKQTSSLSDFKERNGFKRVDLPRYYVPLTRWGSLAFSMGLHRPMADSCAGDRSGKTAGSSHQLVQAAMFATCSILQKLSSRGIRVPGIVGIVTKSLSKLHTPGLVGLTSMPQE